MLSSSTTDGSSMPSSIFNHNPHNEAKMNAFLIQVKKLYQPISLLWTKVLADLSKPDESCIVIKGCHRQEVKKQRRHDGRNRSMTTRCKSTSFRPGLYQLSMLASLSELMLDLLEISLAPGIPKWLKNMLKKNNIINRLLTNYLYRLLENFGHSFSSSKGSFTTHTCFTLPSSNRTHSKNMVRVVLHTFGYIVKFCAFFQHY